MLKPLPRVSGSCGCVRMQREFLDLGGGRLQLCVRSYNDSSRELSVSCPEISLRSLTGCTCVGWLAACAVYAVIQNTMVLSAAIILMLFGLVFYIHFVKIAQESLLVIGSLGIQMSSTFASGRESTSFIEMQRVKDVVINEAIFMQKVIYYLCILLKDPCDPGGVADIVPVFQSSKPRLDCLVELYRSCQEILSKNNPARNPME